MKHVLRNEIFLLRIRNPLFFKDVSVSSGCTVSYSEEFLQWNSRTSHAFTRCTPIYLANQRERICEGIIHGGATVMKGEKNHRKLWTVRNFKNRRVTSADLHDNLQHQYKKELNEKVLKSWNVNSSGSRSTCNASDDETAMDDLHE